MMGTEPLKTAQAEQQEKLLAELSLPVELSTQVRRALPCTDWSDRLQDLTDQYNDMVLNRSKVEVEFWVHFETSTYKEKADEAEQAVDARIQKDLLARLGRYGGIIGSLGGLAKLLDWWRDH